MEPLAPYIKDSGLKLDDVVASSVKAYQYDGQQMAIPRDVDSIAVWYNKNCSIRPASATPPATGAGMI